MDRYLLAFTQRRNHGDNRLDWQRIPTYPSDKYCEHDSCLQALRLFALLMQELTLLRRWRRATEVLSLACFQCFFLWPLRWDLSDSCVDLIDWCPVETTFFPYQTRLSFPAKASWHLMGEPLDPDSLLEWVHLFSNFSTGLIQLTCQCFLSILCQNGPLLSIRRIAGSTWTKSHWHHWAAKRKIHQEDSLCPFVAAALL